jgi:hypothetical protein
MEIHPYYNPISYEKPSLITYVIFIFSDGFHHVALKSFENWLKFSVL